MPHYVPGYCAQQMPPPSLASYASNHIAEDLGIVLVGGSIICQTPFWSRTTFRMSDVREET